MGRICYHRRKWPQKLHRREEDEDTRDAKIVKDREQPTTTKAKIGADSIQKEDPNLQSSTYPMAASPAPRISSRLRQALHGCRCYDRGIEKTVDGEKRPSKPRPLHTGPRPIVSMTIIDTVKTQPTSTRSRNC